VSYWKPCKRCGSTKDADIECSRCGGNGLVTGVWGEPETCPSCGCSGIQYPPICPDCAAYRASLTDDHKEIPHSVIRVASTLQFTGPLCIASLVLLVEDRDMPEWLEGVSENTLVSVEWSNVTMVMKASVARAMLENAVLECQ